MADIEQLQRSLIQADGAGDAAAATVFANEIRRMQGAQTPAPVAAQSEKPWYNNIPGLGDAESAIKQFPRQVGLTARYGMEGLGNAASLVSEPWRIAMNAGAKVAGLPEVPSAGELASNVANRFGLPAPKESSVMDNSGSGERVVGDIARTMAGSAATMGMAGAVAPFTQGVPSAVLKAFSANPGMQLTSAAGSAAAGGAARESGVNPLGQFLASMAGGIAAPAAVSLASPYAKQLATALTPSGKSPELIDREITMTLGKSGVDWSKVNEAVKQSVREDVRKALDVGDALDPAALRRLIDIKSVGGTPTRGMVTLDPVQVTREQNLAKTGANSTDPTLMKLPALQGQNNTATINALNSKGNTNADMYGAGQSNIDRIALADALREAKTGMAYGRADSMPGAETPLNRSSLINNIDAALARENKNAFLPPEIRAMLNNISRGEMQIEGVAHPVPFDAKSIDTLMTTIATAQRSTADGNVKRALGLVRDAIDKTPIQPVKNEFGGNQLVTQEGANFLKGQDAQAGDLIDALRAAKNSHRERMAWQESSAPVSAAIDGAQPDNFIKKFVINGTVADAEALARNGNPEANKAAILTHLKQSALNGASDELGKFGGSAYTKALNGIGDRKLAVFGFSPQEIADLKQIGRARSYMTHQPDGSAVNNSNSGAMVIGKMLDSIAGGAKWLPFGKEYIQSTINGLQQNAAKNVGPALVAPGGASMPFMPSTVPASIYAGLLSSTAIPPRKDDRSR